MPVMQWMLVSPAALGSDVPSSVAEELAALDARAEWPLEVITVSGAANTVIADELGVASVGHAASPEQFTVLATGLAALETPRCGVMLDPSTWTLTPFADCPLTVATVPVEGTAAALPSGGIAERSLPPAASVPPRHALKTLSWGGAGRVRFGKHRITTRRFAKLTNDLPTLDGLSEGRWVVLPGLGLTGAGLGVAAVGLVVAGVGFVVLVFEVIFCGVTFGGVCNNEGLAAMRFGGVLIAVGGGVAAAGGWRWRRAVSLA